MKALTLEEVVSRLGDVNYRCESLEVINGKKYLHAVCPEHGSFKIPTYRALNGSGCTFCGVRSSARTRAYSFETVVAKAKAVHGDKYEYLELLETEGRKSIKVRCPEHGEFVKSTNKLLIGQGCPKCASIEQGRKLSALRKVNPIESPRRLDLAEFVSRATEVHGDKYEYHRLEVIDKRSVIVASCRIHGEFTTPASKHLAGIGCYPCSVDSRAAKRSDSFEGVVAKAKATYGDRYTYLKLIKEEGKRPAVLARCDKHGEFIKPASAFTAGKGCPSCGLDDKSEKLRTPFEDYVKRAHAAHGGKYTYRKINWDSYPTTITYDCPEHGERTQGLNNHVMGAECLLCSHKTTGISGRLTFEDIVTKAKKVHGDTYQYIESYFEGGATRIKYSCNKHGEINQLAAAHIRGNGCKACAFAAQGVSRRDTLESAIQKAEAKHGKLYDYKELSYSEGYAILSYECAKHGMQKQRASEHIYGYGCPSCTSRISKPLLEMKEFLENLGTKTRLEHRFSGSRKFFDLALHDTKVVLEYNGNYWHSSEWIHSSKHLEKSRIAESNGYRCIHIRSDEWANKRTAVEYLLKSAAGRVTEKVYARKTLVVRPSKLEASRLLDTYHIQGSVLQGEFYGLEEDGQLVAVMVFSRNTSSRREKASDSHVELTRYVTCKQVVGGFTKLLNHFLKENPRVNTIASYSDVRIFQGGVYEKAGFAKMHTTPPDYMYLEGDTLYHKANYQKSKLAKRFGAEACEGKTERQITEEQGIYRIYDCGKTKWLYTRK